ncbi:transglycosylase SLT domain-containing protein [Pseudomonas syringae pv. syringae]|uniref:lytic transglycosylase domain-containing protein n=1 Tax=Pseudomonas syringae TaxID=317 RepID=UPI00200AEC3F|nr:lytic transglycosylase domain-containing protein [Pseudomonas syringae]MCK9751799.1 transglycosylase SLT domain-containing protein [Pseudomonas syringae pv. syringae]
MAAVALHASSPRLLARSIQIAVLALGSLCVGCQSVDDSQPRLDRLPRLVAGLGHRSDDAQANPLAATTVSDLPVYNGEDVWQRVAQRCRLVDGQGVNERIARQRDWLLNNRGFLTGASKRATPYLHFIVERLDERNMPLELALLPMIESSYNPLANSPAAAAGLWQFIPSTGRQFNLNQSATYDARRDVVASSKAAMDYLTRLHDQFNNDWLLALAAYNAGEGTVARAIDANRRRGLPVDYWHLNLPRETQDYVPRLLALSLVVRNPGAYGVQLTPVANMPYFDVVELNHTVDLTQLAATTGVDEAQLLRLNPAFLRKKTPDGPGRLLIPKTHTQVLTAGIERITGESPTTAVIPPSPGKRVLERQPSSQVAERAPTPGPLHAAAREQTVGLMQVLGREPAPESVQPVRREPQPKVVQVARQEPLPGAAQPVNAAERVPVSDPIQPERLASSQATQLESQNERSLLDRRIQKRLYIDDRSSPRKRDEIAYRDEPRELPNGPRVVVYASDPRQ